MKPLQVGDVCGMEVEPLAMFGEMETKLLIRLGIVTKPSVVWGYEVEIWDGRPGLVWYGGIDPFRFGGIV